MLPITAIGQGASSQMLNAPTVPQSAKDGANSFSSVLMNAAEQVNSLQNAAGDSARQFVLGQSNDIHSVMIASQKATVALEVATQVRNKVIEAYQNVMQMSM